MLSPLVTFVRTRVDSLRYGFLVGPGLVALAFIGAALLLPHLDALGGPHGLGGFGGDADAARTILSTIAGSLITVAGLTFSITVVSLQLVSQQFSPRALRNFLADRLNQVVAGSFVGIFAYCLLVLRTVRDQNGSEAGFVPSLSVTIAIALGVITVGLLLVFINHMSQTLQVSSIAGRIAHSTLAAAEHLYPDTYGGADAQHGVERLREWREEFRPVYLYPPRPGYVQSVALEGLASRARRLEVPVTPGDFVTERTPVLVRWDGGDADEGLDLAVTVANERDINEDLGYGIRQLADIAIKALSPGVSDPTTACTCIGYLRAILERLAAASFPESLRRDDARDLTVLVRRRTFEEYVDAGLVQIGRYASADVRVAGTLLETIHAVVASAREAGAYERLSCLQEAATAIARRAFDEATSEHDRDVVARLLEQVEQLSSVFRPAR